MNERGKEGINAGFAGVILNILLAAAKIIAGLLSGSLAIAADGYNNLTDAAASIMTIIGFKAAQKPADSEHPFGHARSEYIAGVAVAFFVTIVGAGICKDSIGKIFRPSDVDYGVLSLFVLGISIIVKFSMMVYYRKIGKKITSTTLYAAAADSRNDALATFGVLLSAIIARTFDINIDGYIGLLISVFIIYSGIKLVGEALSPLLGRAPNPDFVDEICKEIKSHPGILGVHDLMVHDYGPGNCFASIHCEMDYRLGTLESHEIVDKIEREFLEKGIMLVIHFDPVDVGETAAGTTEEKE